MNDVEQERPNNRRREPDVAEMLDKEAAHRLQQACGAAAGRPKYWPELSIEEKIERCRDQVKVAGSQLDMLHNLCDQQRQRIAILEAALQQHRHLADGSPVLPLPSSLNHVPGLDRGALGSGMIGRGGLTQTAPADPDKVYF